MVAAPERASTAPRHWGKSPVLGEDRLSKGIPAKLIAAMVADNDSAINPEIALRMCAQMEGGP